jgi:hypothetical protein
VECICLERTFVGAPRHARTIHDRTKMWADRDIIMPKAYDLYALFSGTLK